jgi:hypothetical protein
MNRTPHNPHDNRENGDGKSETHEAVALKTLLRIEMAAVDVYENAMARLKHHHVRADLEKIRDEHARAVTALRSHGTGPDGQPVPGMCPWSTVAVAVNGTAGIISATTALWALYQGEERAVKEYETALQHNGLSAESKQMIRLELLPRARRHLDELKRLMSGMA